jgi:PAS domain S-box-containing protein
MKKKFRPRTPKESYSISKPGDLDEAIEQEQLLASLRESEKRYRSFIENFRGIAYEAYIKTWTPIFFHGAVEEITGYQEEDFIGGNPRWDQIIHPDDLLDLPGKDEIKSVPGYSIQREYRIIRKDGQERWVRGRLHNVCDESGKPTRIQGTIFDITEWKQAEDQLRTEKEFTDMALDAQLDTFFLFEPATGKALRWNRTFRDVSGYSDEEIARLPAPASYYSPRDLELATAFIQNVLLEGTGTIELELICKDGSKIPTEYRVSVIKDDKGEPKYIISIGRDVTERKQAESGLVESEERFRALFEQMPSGVAVYGVVDDGKDFVFKDFNKAAEKIENIKREDVIGKRVKEVFPGVEEFGVFEVFQRVWKTGKAEFFPDTIYKDDRDPGSWRENWIYKLPSGDIIAVYNDVTERKRAEEALQHRYRELTTLHKATTAISSDLSLTVVLRTVAKQMVQAINTDECVLSRWDRQENMVETLVDYSMSRPEVAEDTGTVHDLTNYPATRQVLETRQLIVIRRGDPDADQVELKAMEEYGSEILLMLPLIARDQVVGLVELFDFNRGREYSGDDIRLVQSLATQAAISIEHARLLNRAQQEIVERKQAEEKVRKLNEELERRVIDRTAELEATNKELEAFAYSISHDLRAPLRAINGFSTLLRDKYADMLDEEGNSYLDKVKKSTLKMDQLIYDLLALSRLGRQEFKRTTTNLAHLANRVFFDLVGKEPERIIDFKISELPLVDVDDKLIDVMLTNLLSNAIKFTRDKTPAVIEFGCFTKERTPTFYIRDNGAGFDMKYADKLFSPFQRLHSEEEFEGSGIGLALVQRIIKRHGGEVWAEAKPGRGASFYFTLGKFS